VTADHLSPWPMDAPETHSDQRVHGGGSQLVTPWELASWAIWYTRSGIPVFPCVAGGKRPVPLHGYKDASSAEELARTIWNGRTFYNIAAPTGRFTFDVLDVDVRDGGAGWAAFGRLKGAGLLSGAHRAVCTPSGGLHLYFAGTDQRCSSLKGLFIDLEASGGYVLIPPSEVGGLRYTVVADRPPTGAVLDWTACTRLLSPPRPPKPADQYSRGPGCADHLPGWLQDQPVGNRNRGLFWAACCALEAGDEGVLAELGAVARSAEFGKDEVTQTIRSAWRRIHGGQPA